MNGIIVYDSYALMTGCTKIVDYLKKAKQNKIDPYILFDKKEV